MIVSQKKEINPKGLKICPQSQSNSTKKATWPQSQAMPLYVKCKSSTLMTWSSHWKINKWLTNKSVINNWYFKLKYLLIMH